MSGRILLVPGLLRDDGDFLAAFARGPGDGRALFATRSLLERWRDELLRLLPGAVLGGRRLMLFPGLAGTILGPGARDPMTEDARRAMMAIVISRLKSEGGLRALAASEFTPALAREVLTALGELRRGLVPRERLAELGPADPVLADLETCWAGYQAALARCGKAEADDLLALAAAALAGGAVLPDFTRLLVHGFTDFSFLQAGLLRQVARAAAITVLAPADGLGSVEERAHALRERFPGWEIETARVTPRTASRLDRLASGQASPDPPDESIILLEGEGQYALACLVARTIRRLLASDSDLRPEEIALVQRTAAPASPFLAALRRHGLPVAAQTDAALIGLNSVGTVLAALDCLADDWPRVSVLRLARGVLAGDEAPLADALASVSARLRLVRTREAWDDLIHLEAERFFAGGETGETDAARAAIGRLADGLALLPREGSLADHLRALRSFLAYWRLPAQWWPGESAREMLPAYAREMRGLQALLAALAERAEIDAALAPTRVWTVGSLRDETARLAAEIVLPPRASAGGIRCLDPSEIRGLRFRHVFLVGMAEGEFPKPLHENWLLPEDKRQSLSGPGHGLESRAILHTREWQLLGNVVSAARDTLHLCWSCVDENGDALAPSMFLAYLRELLALAPVRLRAGEIIPRDYSEAWDAASVHARLLADILWEELPPERVPTALVLYGRHRAAVGHLLARAAAERQRRAGTQTFGDPEILAGLRERFGPDRILSVSMLEDYAQCPFVFLCRRLLHVEPLDRPVEEPSGLDLGRAYHAALERFHRSLAGESLVPDRLESYEEALQTAVAEAFTPLARLARTRLARRLLAMGREFCLDKLRSMLRLEAHRAAGAGWRTVHSELGFGLTDGDALDPASVQDPLVLGEGTGTLRLAGKIDRVDSLPDGTYAIYDYKLGRPPESGRVLSGRTLQIPIYLEACRRLFFPARQSAGGGYYSLRDLSRQSGLWRAELAAATGISPRAAGSLSGAAWETALDGLLARALAAAAGIRSGRFPLAGEDCPSYCEFKPICRREER